MCEAASDPALPGNLNASLVERYTDGANVAEGRVQGIRLDIRGGAPSFRVGVGRAERGDVTVEVTSAAARHLNALRGADFSIARERYLASGEMRLEGDPALLGTWLDAVHDPIVDRTT